MPIFDGDTASLLYVVERSNKNQNLQQRNLFAKCFERFELRLPVVELGTIEITQKHVILINIYMTNCPRDNFERPFRLIFRWWIHSMLL